MRNRTYGGVRGRKTKVGRKLLRFPPTRFLFPPPLHSIVNLFLVCPVRTKTFSTHVASKMVHVVRKTGLSTHAGNE